MRDGSALDGGREFVGCLVAVLVLGTLLVTLPSRSAFGSQVTITFSGQLTSGNEALDFNTIGTPVSGAISFDTDSFTSTVFSNPQLSEGYYVPTPTTSASAHVIAGSIDAVSTLISLDIQDWDPNTNSGSSDIQDTWAAGSGFFFTPGGPGYNNVYTMEVSLEDRTMTRITSPEFFIPMTLDGFTRAAVDFYYYPGRGPARVVGSASITQWSVIVAPEPNRLALLGVVVVGLLLRATGLRNA